METADVAVPIWAACNPWTQFESFPEFMPGVKSVTQLTDSINRWVTKIGPVERAFHTKVVEQHPDQRIARRSVDVKSHARVITFTPSDALNTKVTARFERTPEPVAEKARAGPALGDLQVKADLRKFKDFIESRKTETGA